MAVPKFMAPFKRELEALSHKGAAFFRQLHDDIRQAMRDSKAPDCWERTFLEKQGDYGLSDGEGAHAVGTLFSAGSSTTAAALMSFMLALVHHPEWQKRVQEEVDQQVMFDTLLGFEDMVNLPTVRAFVKEVIRWRPVTAGGIPHLLIKDDEYNGMFIPAGTNVHANQWLEAAAIKTYWTTQLIEQGYPSRP
jgi:cytochrome P450